HDLEFRGFSARSGCFLTIIRGPRAGRRRRQPATRTNPIQNCRHDGEVVSDAHSKTQPWATGRSCEECVPPHSREPIAHNIRRLQTANTNRPPNLPLSTCVRTKLQVAHKSWPKRALSVGRAIAGATRCRARFLADEPFGGDFIEGTNYQRGACVSV